MPRHSESGRLTDQDAWTIPSHLHAYLHAFSRAIDPDTHPATRHACAQVMKAMALASHPHRQRAHGAETLGDLIRQAIDQRINGS